MTADRLEDILSEIGEVRRYSGRGMYGAECPGVILEGSLIGAAVDLLLLTEDRDEQEAIGKVIRGAKTDSMGVDTILYFPKVTYPKEVAS